MNTQKQILLIVVLFFTLVGGCAAYSIIDLPVRAPDQATWTQDQSVERGALLFANNCRTCHGIMGQGGVGLPLNKAEFKDQDPLVLAANQQLLKTTISCGRAGTRMPAWLNTNGGSINAEQIQHLIDLITEPADPNLKDANGQPFVDANGDPSSAGWLEAVGFAHNLNRETNAVVGGDTLDTIAKAHLIGYAELAAANNVPVVGTLQQGSTLHIPGFGQNPGGYTYTVYKDNETITKVADSQHVGALILADLNKIPYDFTEKKEVTTFTLLDEQGNPVPGLLPGTTLRLPETAQYVVSSGDTLDAIAQSHNISASAIKDLNTAVLAKQNYTDTSKPLSAQNKLTLPPNTNVVVEPGQTVGTIATAHGVAATDLEKLNGLTDESPPPLPGATIKLPEGTTYIVQTGDTLDSIAKNHGITTEALATANNLKPTDAISDTVALKLPPVEKYNVKYQTLADVAKGYSNVTADSLAAANNTTADAKLRIGTKLNLPADAWGSAPPDTINNGTACVQHAVPDSTFQQILPGSPTATATQPANVSNSVSAVTNANDFTLTADGTPQPANQGVVLIAKGSSITFTNKAGLHTIDENGKNTGTGIDFGSGATRTLTFNDAGTFKITCEVHPAMLATVFVQ